MCACGSDMTGRWHKGAGPDGTEYEILSDSQADIFASVNLVTALVLELAE